MKRRHRTRTKIQNMKHNFYWKKIKLKNVCIYQVFTEDSPFNPFQKK